MFFFFFFRKHKSYDSTRQAQHETYILVSIIDHLNALSLNILKLIRLPVARVSRPF